MFFVLDALQRRLDFFAGEQRMVLGELLRDVLFVVVVEILDAAVVLDHFNEHVSHAQAENVVLELGVGDFRYGVVQNVAAHLVVEVVVSVLV